LGSVPLPLRHNRDFQLLWSGQAVSLLGSQTAKIAYPLLVLAMTGSPAKAGIAGFATMLGYLLFALPGGALADRYDRKRIMIACDVIRLLAVGSIAVACWAAHITYVQILVAGFVEGTATVFFGLAERAALPMLVHPSQRSVAIGQNEARQNAAQLAGPALGGALFGLSWAARYAPGPAEHGSAAKAARSSRCSSASHHRSPGGRSSKCPRHSLAASRIARSTAPSLLRGSGARWPSSTGASASPASASPASASLEAGSPSRIAAAFLATVSPSVPASSSLCIIRTPLWSLMLPLHRPRWSSRLHHHDADRQ
jgi:MFS family permease